MTGVPSTFDRLAHGMSPRGPVVLIYSPMAGESRAKHARELLKHAGVSVALSIPIQSLNGAEPQGARWREAGCVAAVAAGGDGTVGTVSTHAVRAGLPVGVLPYGTANDVARSLRIPLALEQAAQTVAWGEPQPVDAGQVLYLDEPSEDAYFLHALTLGLNVEFARLATDAAQRRRWGRLTYAVSAFESLEHYKPLAATLRFSDVGGVTERSLVLQSDIALLAAINLPVLGGRMEFRAPGVRSDDQLLDYLLLEARAPRDIGQALAEALNLLGGATQALLGHRDPIDLAAPGVRWIRARSLHIETDEAAGVTVDGEVHRHTPAVAQVAPLPVQMIIPTAHRGDAIGR